MAFLKVLRKKLSHHPQFDAYQLFKCIDKKSIGMITADDVFKFITVNLTAKEAEPIIFRITPS